MLKQRIIFFLSILLLVLADSSFAEEKQWDIDSETLFLSFERETDIDDDSLIFPVYEYLSADYGSTLSEGLSIHFHGWGRHDLSNNRFYNEDTDGELLYAYLAYQFSNGGPVVNIGRQSIFTGITDERIDGLRFETPFLSSFVLSAYAGIPTSDGEDEQRDDHQIYGGRFDYKINSAYDFGVYYQTVTETRESDDEKIGVDFAALLPANILFSGNSLFNLTTSGWAEHDYSLNLNIDNFNIHPFFHQYQYQGLFDSSAQKSSPFRYLAQSDEILSEIGSDLIWRKIQSLIEMGCTYKNYSYDKQSETNNYYSGFVNLIPKNLMIGFEIGFMDGEEAENSFISGRSYISTQTISLIADSGSLSADITYVNYDQPIYETDYSIFVSLTCQQNFYKDALNVILSCDYSKDPYYDSDFGASMIIKYQLGNGF
jgi:hypothetical protein